MPQLSLVGAMDAAAASLHNTAKHAAKAAVSLEGDTLHASCYNNT
jgi:hypothetical protein